jgi:predicted NBD/HSP70 family sugar kinase
VVTGLKHQKGKRGMVYFAGLDVSVEDTNACIVDGTGKIVREVKVVSEPQALSSTEEHHILFRASTNSA